MGGGERRAPAALSSDSRPRRRAQPQAQLVLSGNPLDEDEVYEGILGGTWAPYCLVSYTGDVELPNGEVVKLPNIAPTIDGFEGDLSPFSGISGLNNVNQLVEGSNLPRVTDETVDRILYSSPFKHWWHRNPLGL